MVVLPWMWIELSAFAALGRRHHVHPDEMRRVRNRSYRAMGCFQLAVASALIGLSLLEDDNSAWVSVPFLVILGLGFIVISFRSSDPYR